MIRGLVLGKFYPLHTGHIALIEFAQQQCDELIVLICATKGENITGSTRLQWMQETFKNNAGIKPTLLHYSEQELPNTSISSEEVSAKWALKINSSLPKVDIVFSSEIYGSYLASFLACRHITFDLNRTSFPISGSDMRQDAFKHWDFLANAAKPFFVQKICIYGTESTGKSTLAKQLARYFKTDFVPEMAREIITETDECTGAHLKQIATLQALTINEKLKTANRLLFVDTDLNTTRSYSKFLFGVALEVDEWIEKANRYKIYLYLDNDVPHIQDGTRLNEQRRNELNVFHKKELTDKGITFELIRGTWKERFEKSIAVINNLSSFFHHHQ